MTVLTDFEKMLYGIVLKDTINNLSRFCCSDYPVLCTPEIQEEMKAFIEQNVMHPDQKNQMLAQAASNNDVFFADFEILEMLKKRLGIE